MCGFTCIIKKDIEENLQINNKILKHRGPDSFSTINHMNLSMSHWRLSIVDLTSNSDQPIQDDNYIFAYNGEIYDHENWGSKYGINEIGDTRKVFQIIKKTNSFSDLYDQPGFFSLVFYNKINQTIKGTRDKFGKKPLYYYLDDQTFILSSEEKGILPYVKNISVNKYSVNNYFLYKDRFYGETVFTNIFEVPPGAQIDFDIRKWHLRINSDWKSYYNNNNLLLNKTLDEDLEICNYDKTLFEKKFKRIFIDSVSSRLNSDVPIQLALSGGVDSFLIGKTIMNNKKSNKLTQSITVDFNSLSEANNAKKNAKYLGITNSLVKFSEYDFLDLLEKAIDYNSGPLEHPHSLAYFLLCMKASLNGKVLITGEGADELLFGYNHYNNFNKYSFAFREFLCKEDEILYGKNSFNQIREMSKVNYLREYAVGNSLNSRTMEFKTHLLSLLRRNDRMGMANSIEIRSPFLDPRLVDFILKSNFNLLYKNKQEFMHFLLNDKYVSNNILSIEKIGFRVPFDEFFYKNKNSKRIQSIIELGSNLIYETSGLKLVNHEAVYSFPRLAWVLINLGITKKLFFS